MLLLLLYDWLFCCEGGGGLANGFGGPDAPALSMALALGEGGGRTTPVPEEWLASVLAFRGVGPVTIQIVGRMAFLCRYSNFRNTERRTASQNLALSACSRMSEKYSSGLQKSAFVPVRFRRASGCRN